MTSESKSKAELALMGRVVPIINNKEAIEITDYITNVLKVSHHNLDIESGTEVIDNRVNQFGHNIVRHMVVNTLMDEFQCITYCLQSDPEPDEDEEESEQYPDDLTTHDGVFSYVYNVSAPDLSELGYTFYEKRVDNTYHRIGQC